MAGITETKEAIAAVAALVKEIKALSADGFQWSDAIALADKFTNDPVFSKKMTDGAEGIELIAGELADISFFEGLDLLKTLSAEFKGLKV